MNYFKRLLSLFIIPAILLVGLNSCDSVFGTKEDDTTNEIFEEGRQDPNNVDDIVGYAALLPFWDGFQNPKDIFIGYDELVYVVDDIGLHVLDLAGRRFRTLELREASDVTMDRNLHIFVSARDSIEVPKNVNGQDQLVKFDLPVVYKIKGLNQNGDATFVDTLIFPFDDATLTTFNSQTRRLDPDRNRDDQYEKVEITGLATLADNSLYVSRTGPKNNTNSASSFEAPDNAVLVFDREIVDGTVSEKMRNSRYIRAVDPATPSLKSGIGMTSIETFIGPPQREQFPDNTSFLITQTNQFSTPDKNPPFKVLWISAVQTIDGIEFQSTPSLLDQDTTEANRFLYTAGRFQNPTDVTYATDGSGYIFVTDSGTDSLYLFQSNGYEGVNPPVGSDEDKAIIVSFGGEGTGPKNLIDPQAVVYFNEVLYVADSGNNRIARYKLTTDFE